MSLRDKGNGVGVRGEGLGKRLTGCLLSICNETRSVYSKHLPCIHTVLYTHKLVLLYTVQVERVPGLFTKNAFFLLGERGASRWLERVVCMCTMFIRDDGSDTVYIGLRTRLLYLDG